MKAFVYLVLFVSLLRDNVRGYDENPETEIQDPEKKVLNEWRSLEMSLTEKVDELVLQVVPKLIRTVSEADVSGECQSSLLTLVNGIRRLERWATEMIDAWGKPPAGILMGTFTSFGSYSECLKIKRNFFVGQYCTLKAKLDTPPHTHFTYMHSHFEIFQNYTKKDSVMTSLHDIAPLFGLGSLRLGICTPSTCTEDDLRKLITKVGGSLPIHLKVENCEIQEELEIFRKTPSQLALGVLSSLLLIVLIATLYDLSFGPDVDLINNEPNLSKSERIRNLVLCFSVQRTLPRVLRSNSSLSTLSFVHSFQTLSVVWFIHSSIFIYNHPALLTEAFSTGLLSKLVAMQFVFSSPLAIDTFVFIGSFVMAYTIANANKVQKKSFTWYFGLIATNVLRKMSAIGLILAVLLIIPFLGNGPMWKEIMDPLYKNCTERWWTILLFITNFADNANNRCLRNTWMISVEIQLLIVAIILSAVFSSGRKTLGFILSALMFSASICYVAVVTYTNQYPPAILILQSAHRKVRMELEEDIYRKPYTYLAAMSVGVILGHLLSDKGALKKNPIKMSIGWLTAIATFLAVIIGAHQWQNEGWAVEDLNMVTLYAALHRPAWALVLAFLVYACASGQAETLRELLSSPIWFPIGRLGVTSLLTSQIFSEILFAQVTNRAQGSNLIAFFFFSGNLLMGLVLNMTFELLLLRPLSEIIKLSVPSLQEKPIQLSSRRPNRPPLFKTESVQAFLS